MSRTRYFKATDGQKTYFRASPTQVYQSLSVDPTRPTEWGWTLHRHANGRFPAAEITRQEYVALTALKQQRGAALKAAWEAKNGRPYGYGAFASAPRDSWVDNADLEAPR